MDMVSNPRTSLATTVARPDWNAARGVYLSARATLDAFEAANIYSHFAADLPVGPERSAGIARVPKAAWAESQRLLDLLSDAEDVLMAVPSPDPVGFAFKYLVAFGDGRETDCWNDMLEAEAKRFTSVEA